MLADGRAIATPGRSVENDYSQNNYNEHDYSENDYSENDYSGEGASRNSVYSSG